MRVALIAGIINLLFVFLFLYQYAIVSPIYKEVGATRPSIVTNPLFILYFALAIVAFIFWNYLRSKAKAGIKVKYASVISIILLIAPFIIFYAISVYSTNQAIQNLDTKF